MSLTASNGQANDDSSFPALSSNGSFLAFVSKADLTGVGTAGIQNLYLRKVDGSSTKLFSAGSGTGANAPVYTPVITNDSRYIAYVSAASNLVAGDSNGTSDVFLYDRATGLTQRVSVDSAGGQADGSSSMPSVSDDGNVIAFESKATNLVAGDSNGLRDLFVRNRSAGTTTRVSIDASGAQSNGISYHATLTRDGSRVAFASQASNLVAGDTNNVADVFQRLVADPTSIDRASRNIVGDVQGDGPSDLPSYDSDDNDLAFRSSSTNLDWANAVSNNEIFLANRASGTASVVGRIETPEIGLVFQRSRNQIWERFLNEGQSCVSADGRYVVFTSYEQILGNSGKKQVFVRDRKKETTTLVSADSSGLPGNLDSADIDDPAISADGRFVTFSSRATNLIPNDVQSSFLRVYLRDLVTGRTTKVSASMPYEHSLAPTISGDGRFVAYASQSSLTPAEEVDLGLEGPSFKGPAVYIFDQQTSKSIRLNTFMYVANGERYGLRLSKDGSSLTFLRSRSQIYVYNLRARTAGCVSVNSNGIQGDSYAQNPEISADGRYVFFKSGASNLVSLDEYNAIDWGGNSKTSLVTPSWPSQPTGLSGGRPVAGGQIGVFVHDRVQQSTKLLAGTLQKADGLGMSLSFDGRFLNYSLSGNVRGTLRNEWLDLAHFSEGPVSTPVYGEMSGDGRFAISGGQDQTTYLPNILSRRLLFP